MNSHVRNLLVTGGAGFIGATFVHYWRRKYPADSVVVLDALTYAGNRMNLRRLEESKHFRFVHGDIRDRALVESILREAGLPWVNFDGWKRIDAREATPPQSGRARRKIRELESLMEIGARVAPPTLIDSSSTTSLYASAYPCRFSTSQPSDAKNGFRNWCRNWSSLNASER